MMIRLLHAYRMTKYVDKICFEIPTIAEKTAKNLRGYFFAARCIIQTSAHFIFKKIDEKLSLTDSFNTT